MKKLLLLALMFLSLNIEAQSYLASTFEKIDSITQLQENSDDIINIYLSNDCWVEIEKNENSCKYLFPCPLNGQITEEELPLEIFDDIKNGNINNYMVFFEGYYLDNVLKSYRFEIYRYEDVYVGKYKAIKIIRTFNREHTKKTCLRFVFEPLENNDTENIVVGNFDLSRDNNRFLIGGSDYYIVGDIFDCFENPQTGLSYLIFSEDNLR